jgi:hypothetical protein
MLGTNGVSAVMPALETLRCRRLLWVDNELNYFGNPDGPKLDEVNQLRRCEGFLRYKPGLSPQEHMQRLEKSEERKAQFGYVFLAAFLGSLLTAALSLLAQWAARHFGIGKP